MKEKNKYTKTINWKQFYRNVFALVIPIAIQNLINVGVTATDVIMLGKVGEKVLSGASLAGQIQYIMTLIFYGVTSGATVLTAQYWGKKDRRSKVFKNRRIFLCVHGGDTGVSEYYAQYREGYGGYIYLSDFIADEYCGKCGSDLRTIWIPDNGSKGCGNRYAVCQSSRDSDGSRLCHLPK